MGNSCGARRFGPDKAVQAQRGLAGENLQNLPFQGTVAKRHSSEMLLVDDTVGSLWTLLNQ